MNEQYIKMHSINDNTMISFTFPYVNLHWLSSICITYIKILLPYYSNIINFIFCNCITFNTFIGNL